jgi:hypothetical protein
METHTGVGNCFCPGGLRRDLFDVRPTRRPKKAKKTKRENGKSAKMRGQVGENSKSLYFKSKDSKGLLSPQR